MKRGAPIRILTIGLGSLVLGGTCLPLIDETQHQAIPGHKLGISVTASMLGETVAEGTKVDILWAAGNLTGQPATVQVTLESRQDLSQVILLEGFVFDGTGYEQTFTWNTEGYSGPYSIIARVTAGELTSQDKSRGLVTVDSRPRLYFTAPPADAEYTPDPNEPLKIAWVGGDESGTVSIGLDPDTDHESGNEIWLITDRTLPYPAADDSFDWTGTDVDGAAVEPGPYNLFATATDDINDVVRVDGLGLIIILED